MENAPMIEQQACIRFRLGNDDGMGEQAEKYRSGEITKGPYDEWRYNFLKYDTTEKWGKIPS